jgi:DNA repair exonuclease SbcCD ATPase subunit
MIQELRLKSFQAHSTLRLEFDPGVNAIVGETDSGKSACFRAIRWLVEHSPPTGYLKHGEKDLRVGIKSDIGTVIRFKNSKGYGYSVDGQDFLACATKQPPEVSQTTGLSPINLQGQHDPPFLLTLTPGEFARALNRVVDLSSIDIATAEVKRALAQERTIIDHLDSKVKDLEAKDKSLAWIPGAFTRYAELESVESALEKTTTQISGISGVLELLEITEVDFKAARTLADAISTHNDRCIEIRKKMRENAITEVKNAIDGFREADNRFNAGIPLVEALTRLVDIADIAEELEARIRWIQPSLEILRKTEKVSAVQTGAGDIIQLCNRTTEAKTALESVRTVVKDVRDIEAEIAKLEASKGKLQEAIGPVCPTCGKPIKGK